MVTTLTIIFHWRDLSFSVIQLGIIPYTSSMSQVVALLGRQPALGMAELESIFGTDAVQALPGAALVDCTPADFPMHRLGGTIKAAKLLTTLPYTDWPSVERYLAEQLPAHVGYIPEGKIRLGLSTYGFRLNPKQQNAAGLALKKVIKNTGRSVRVVPNTANELNAAQVTHNQLTGPTGLELVLIRDGDRTVLAQTFAVQDIDAYAARDQARPKRDARVGMLPPKLAQIIVNLALPRPGGTVLDPFCGTGVVLQEAFLMGNSIYGTDLDARMIDYTNQNLTWLEDQTKKHIQGATEVADATAHTWQEMPFQAIACETYLGRPFSALPGPDVLAEVVQDVDTIHKKFLKNVARQAQPGFRLCIAVPAWKTKSGFKHLPTLENLAELGYTRVSFARVRHDDLVYHRENQIVARELVVLTRK
jgi:tRNA G10  N-methylase Trm11